MAEPDEMVGIGPAPERTLAECEAVIARGLDTFVEVGLALQEIREGRLYRQTHDSFEAYCRERWGWGRSYANKLISSTEIVSALGTTVPSERQARELGRLRDDPEAVREVWAEVTEATGGKPTAANIRQFVDRRLEALPAQERPKAAALVSQPGVDARSATRIIANLAEKPAEERQRIWSKAESADARDRADALAAAADLPPMPDPRLTGVLVAIDDFKHFAEMFPGDPLNDEFRALAHQLAAFAAKIKEAGRVRRTS